MFVSMQTTTSKLLSSTDKLLTPNQKHTSLNTNINVTNPNQQKTILHSKKYEYEGKNENKSSPMQTEIKTNNDRFNVTDACRSMYSDITGIAIKRNLTTQAIIDAFITLISTTNTKQRQEIKIYYQQQFGFDLNHYINQNFKGIFKRILLYSMHNAMERDLYILSVGVKKMKDINCILPLLCIYESDRITKLMNSYQNGIFEKTLKQQIIKLTDNNSMLRSYVVSILNGSRKRLPSILLRDDALFLRRVLLNLKNKSEWKKKDEIIFIDIFTRRSFQYLRTLCASFESLTHISLCDAIKCSFGCNRGIGYAIYCTLMFVVNQKEFYQKLLMKGIVAGAGGHKYILFWRIIINQMDYDLIHILNGYGMYEGGKSDVDTYNLNHFVKVRLNRHDQSAAKLITKICKF